MSEKQYVNFASGWTKREDLISFNNNPEYSKVEIILRHTETKEELPVTNFAMMTNKNKSNDNSPDWRVFVTVGED